MTPRQQRRLQQKLARKAQKQEQRHQPQTDPEPVTQASQVAQAVPPAISEAKLTANRANAQFSTGATSPEGKAIVSQNATRHGLTGKFKVLAGESQSEFDQLLAGFLRSEAPLGGDEIEMVHQMAEALWLSRRCVRLQNECFARLESGTAQSAKGADARSQTEEEDLQSSGGAPETAPVLRVLSEEQRAGHKQLALFMRYQITHDRTFSRYATELRKRRNERARAERGFVSQKRAEAQQERRAANEKRKQELHELKVLIQKARLERLGQQNRKLGSEADLARPRKCAASDVDALADTTNCLQAAA